MFSSFRHCADFVRDLWSVYLEGLLQEKLKMLCSLGIAGSKPYYKMCRHSKWQVGILEDVSAHYSVHNGKCADIYGHA